MNLFGIAFNGQHDKGMRRDAEFHEILIERVAAVAESFV